MAKKKESHILLKIISFPFKIIWKIFYYTAKGIYILTKGTINKIIEYRKRKREESLKPQTKADYKKFEETKLIDGNFASFEEVLNSNGKIGIILGGRGNGKSALGLRAIENVKAKTNKKVAAWGFESSVLPAWIKNIDRIEEIENNTLVLIDESGISFSSRNSMGELNKLLSELILIARHKNLSIMFITQNSSNIDINILRQADYLMLKPHSLLQLNFERKIIKDIYSEVEKDYKNSKDKSLTYIYSGNYKGFIKNKLPSFWNERTSKSFANEKISESKNNKN